MGVGVHHFPPKWNAAEGIEEYVTTTWGPGRPTENYEARAITPASSNSRISGRCTQLAVGGGGEVPGPERWYINLLEGVSKVVLCSVQPGGVEPWKAEISGSSEGGRDDGVGCVGVKSSYKGRGSFFPAEGTPCRVAESNMLVGGTMEANAGRENGTVVATKSFQVVLGAAAARLAFFCFLSPVDPERPADETEDALFFRGQSATKWSVARHS
eukprot:gene9971-6961_t